MTTHPTPADIREAIEKWDDIGAAGCIFELGESATVIRALLNAALEPADQGHICKLCGDDVFFAHDCPKSTPMEGSASKHRSAETTSDAAGDNQNQQAESSTSEPPQTVKDAPELVSDESPETIHNEINVRQTRDKTPPEAQEMPDAEIPPEDLLAQVENIDQLAGMLSTMRFSDKHPDVAKQWLLAIKDVLLDLTTPNTDEHDRTDAGRCRTCLGEKDLIGDCTVCDGTGKAALQIKENGDE